MSTTLDDIKAALLTAGVVTDGAVTDWKIMLGYMQDAPDKAVCIYETGGDAPDPSSALDYPGLQVRVRGEPDGYQEMRAKLQEIFDNLHANEVSVGTDYVYIYAVQSGPIPMGQDEKRRPHVVQNFRIMRNRPT